MSLIENCSDEAQWQNVENTSELFKFIPTNQVKSVPSRQKEIYGIAEKILNSAEEKLMLSKEAKNVASLEDDIAPTKEVKNAEEIIGKLFTLKYVSHYFHNEVTKLGR